METVIFLVGVTAVAVVISLAAFVLGWLFTEVTVLPLNFKPFTCRPCLTFWFTLILNAVYSLVVAPVLVRNGITPYYWAAVYSVGLIGVLLAFLSFATIKLKYRIYD